MATWHSFGRSAMASKSAGGLFQVQYNEKDWLTVRKALDNKRLEKAYFRGVNDAQKSAVSNANSTASKMISKRFNIRAKAAKDAGAVDVKFKFIDPKGPSAKFLGLVKVTANSLSPARFNKSAFKERVVKTPVGRSGKPGRRKQIRLKLLRGGQLKSPERKKNAPKRWAHPRPEFVGFRQPEIRDGLVFFRKDYPRGGKGARKRDRKLGDTLRTIDPAHMMLNKYTIDQVYKKLGERMLKRIPHHISRQLELAARGRK